MPLHLDREGAALHDRNLVLADLVALRQVRVEVILAREDAARRDMGADGQPELDGALDGALVQHGQHARQREVHGRGLRVGFGPERGGGAGKIFEAVESCVCVSRPITTSHCMAVFLV